MRLFASPMCASDYILGYTLPLLPMALAQIAVCFIVALFLGLAPTWSIMITILVLLLCIECVNNNQFDTGGHFLAQKLIFAL